MFSICGIWGKGMQSAGPQTRPALPNRSPLPRKKRPDALRPASLIFPSRFYFLNRGSTVSTPTNTS